MVCLLFNRGQLIIKFELSHFYPFTYMSGLIYYMTFFFVLGSRKSYVILMGGSCQMLTIDDKGGGRGVKNPKNLLMQYMDVP